MEIINYDEKEYIIDNTIVKYLISDDENVSMLLIPKECASKIKDQWTIPWDDFDPVAKYMHRWEIGSLAYIHICGEYIDRPGTTMKGNYGFVFENQEHISDENYEKIVTYLKNASGYVLKHTLLHKDGDRVFSVNTEFINNSGKNVEIDMLSSFALDNLSPFQADDAPNKYMLHRFLGGWSMEGRLLSQPIEELNLEKTWTGFLCNNEQFGSLGSYPCNKYFPTAVFEDTDAGVCWAASVACNSTWQMELTRYANTLSFTGGLGDNDFCGWKKLVKSGQSFCAPTAYVTAVCGDVNDACNALLDSQRAERKNDDLPIVFNEYCTTWGKPTQEKMLSYCKKLSELGIKYAVIDAGWCKAGCEQNGNGEWNIDTSIFPNVKEMNSQMRSMGIIPGIWFEFEVTTEGSKMFEPEYDFMKLKRNGQVVKARNIRSFWDFRRSDVREYLHKKVIEFLKENGFGYIKVDYNGNIGAGVDGAESPAEGLRQHLECVRDFFESMKVEIPDLVVENCASGGHRLEPSMINITDLSSFSDASESVENPYIALNLHNLIDPSKELVWAVVHNDDSKERLVYSLASSFLGRVCLSGDIDILSDWQEKIIKKGLDFYKKLSYVIKNGVTKVYGNRGKSMRYPTGVQIAVRRVKNQILVVYHGFDKSDGKFEIEIPNGFKISDAFYNECGDLSDGILTVKDVKPFTAGAILLESE